MNFLFPEMDLAGLWSGAASAIAGKGMLGALAMGSGSASADNLDLDDPQQNLMAMLKIRGDISGEDFVFAFPGEVWAMIPNQGNYRLFKTFGVGAGHLEDAPEGWRILSREVLYYLDPDSGGILDTWNNPLPGYEKKVGVVHVNNDPINGVFTADGKGVLAAPYPYVAYGDDIIFQWNFFINRPSYLTRKDYPLYSAGDIDQHAEMWGIQGRKSDVLNPDVTSGQATISWARVCQWLPFMEMGDTPGFLVFHSHCYKLTGGVQDLPRHILDYTEKHFPKYLVSPTEWNGFEMQDYSDVCRKMVDRGEIRKFD